MRKIELVKIWNQLDKACEAIEKLEGNDIDTDGVDLSAMVILKNNVEEMIESRTRKK